MGAFKRESGQAIVEYAIVFPILLVITLGIIQLAYIFVAKQVVNYAAFCAARAALVGEDYQRAAVFACTPIAGLTVPGGAPPPIFDLPGWGPMHRSGASLVKTEPVIISGDPSRFVIAEVVHRFELTIPIADEIAYRLAEVLMGVEDVDRATYGAPHIRIRSTAMLAVPPGSSYAQP